MLLSPNKLQDLASNSLNNSLNTKRFTNKNSNSLNQKKRKPLMFIKINFPQSHQKDLLVYTLMQAKNKLFLRNYVNKTR